MVRVARAESGEEEWSCPRCGRRMLLRWPPPRFEVTILAEGDSSASHIGTKASVPPEQASSWDITMSHDELVWLHDHGIEWNDRAS
jgi:DNA-directed RNA polymerase subunit RPC12/RpoP